MAIDAPVIDTLRYADNLKQAGVDDAHADGMSRALNVELSERMLTKEDLREAFDRHSRMFDERLAARDKRLDAVEQRLGAVEQRLGAVEQRLGAVEQRLEAMDARMDAFERDIDRRFADVHWRIDALESLVNLRFKMMMGTMVFGFTVVIALGLFNVAPKLAVGAAAEGSAQPAAAERQAVP